MKEPWEIYWDELSSEMRRLFKKNPSPAQEEIFKAEQTAAEAVAYHIVEQLHYLTNEAVEVIELFRASQVDKNALQHVWTGYVLRRQRRR